MNKILVVGGAGYVGSHVVIDLINKQFEVVIVDNFSNSNPLVIAALEKLTNRKITFYPIDYCSFSQLKQVFEENKITAVIHCAGLKSVNEATKIPLDYYRNNVSGLINLLTIMQKKQVFHLVFSSSATVYGTPLVLPITEEADLTPISPYGQTKKMNEIILKDLARSDKRWRFISLRFFNPIGAHSSGDLGEDPKGIPNNLIPYITQIALGNLPSLKIFGSTFNTIDGTTVRDYLHIEDLALGHTLALNYLLDSSQTNGFDAINLGSGKGYSVLEIITTFEKVTGTKIPYEYTKKRTGDVAKSFASIQKAKALLNWQPAHSLEQMCLDAWRWQEKHPQGFE
ncbi:UDP-glucose 4-epimerase GalE [Enterococcus sp. LJL99]